LTGRRPFSASEVEALLTAQAVQQPPPLAEFGVRIPPAAEAILWKALAKSPLDRYQSAKEMREAIESVLALPDASPAAPSSRGGRRDGRPRGLSDPPSAAPAGKPRRAAGHRRGAPGGAVAPDVAPVGPAVADEDGGHRPGRGVDRAGRRGTRRRGERGRDLAR